MNNVHKVVGITQRSQILDDKIKPKVYIIVNFTIV